MFRSDQDFAQRRRWNSRKRRIRKIIAKLLRRIIPRLVFGIPLLFWFLSPIQLRPPLDSIAYFIAVAFALTQLIPLLEDLFVLMAMITQSNIQPPKSDTH